MRTRIFGKMLNSEVQDYLSRNDIIIVPVGTTEMHGGFPLDCETVISEAYALKMAEACDGLVLTGLPYFYAGATASGRGTVQVSVRQGIDYLGAIARSLLRLGFKRQVYISFHGPAHMTICPPRFYHKRQPEVRHRASQPIDKRGRCTGCIAANHIH